MTNHNIFAQGATLAPAKSDKTILNYKIAKFENYINNEFTDNEENLKTFIDDSFLLEIKNDKALKDNFDDEKVFIEIGGNNF